MARVLERFFGPRQMADIRYDPFLQHLSRAVLSDGDPRIMNWAILDLAALVCKPRNPDCPRCPLKARCRYACSASLDPATRPSPSHRPQATSVVLG